MVTKKDKKIWMGAIGLGVYHIILHYIGIRFITDPKSNFLYCSL